MLRIPRRSRERWHREAVRAITRGGYSISRADADGSMASRSSRTLREATAELRRLEALGEEATAPTWGPRRKRAIPRVRNTRRRSVPPSQPTKLYRSVLALTRRSTFGWRDVVMTFTRHGHFMVGGRRVTFLVAVSVHALGRSRSASIYASIDACTPEAAARARGAKGGLRAAWKKHRDGWMYLIIDSRPNARSTTRTAERIWRGLADGTPASTV
jgi:hypothetical protein